MPTTINESVRSAGSVVTVTVRADVLVIDLQPARVGTAVSAAIARAVSLGIKSIGEMAKGGRHLAFNNTGTLANGITVEQSGVDFEIVPPAGYLQSDDVMQRLIDLVPEISDPLSDPSVNDAIMKALDDAIVLK